MFYNNYLILRKNLNTYLLLDLIKNKDPKYYHVTQMKPFHFDPSHTDPVDVARRDYLEFFIESVLAHRGNKILRRLNSFSLLNG